MVKGTQRQMVMVRTTESEIFETAYFVIRADAIIKNTQKSIIDEANGIVSAMCADGLREKRARVRRIWARILPFLGGAIVGFSLCMLLVSLAENF